MTKINYYLGDLFDNVNEGDLLIHVCNNRGAMASGFVVPLAKYYPDARACYIDWFHQTYDEHNVPPNLGEVQFVNAPFVSGKPTICVGNMIAQTLEPGKTRQLDYEALYKCLEKVVIHKGGPMCPRLVFPLFGSGLAGGSWSIVAAMIDEVVAPYFDILDCYVMNETDLPEEFRPLLIKPNGMDT